MGRVNDFPHEKEPDGNIYLPHHFWLGIIMALGGWVLWGTDPAGAYLSLAGLYVIADDLLEHFFGWPMPLDRAFKRALLNPRFRALWVKYVIRFYRK